MKLLTRSEWGATYNVDQRPPMQLPVAHAFLHHTVTVPSNNPAADMAQIEGIDIARFGYPSYSWVIHPTGVVLEGMGTHIGAHTIHNNSTSFGISFIGNFENDTPTDAALEACETLLAARIAQGHLTSDFELRGHRDVFATACPGANLYPLVGQIRANVNKPPAPPPEDDMPGKQFQLPDGTIVVVPSSGAKPWVVPGPGADAYHFVTDTHAVDGGLLKVTNQHEADALLALTK